MLLGDLVPFQVSGLKFHPLQRLFTARLHRGDAYEVLGERIGRKSLRGHLNQTHKGAPKVGKGSATAIDNRSRRHHHSAKSTDDVDGFLNAAAARDDILRDNEALTWKHLKATHDKASVPIFLDEDVTGTEMTCHFLTDDNAAYGGGDNRWLLAVYLRMEGTELLSQLAADLSGYRGILQKQGTLEKVAAMESGTENEMAVEEGTGLFEESENVGHGIKVIGINAYG